MGSRKSRPFFFCGIFMGLFILSLPPAQGAGNMGRYLCDVDFVADKIGNPQWVILDGRGGADYQKGHIPGAVNFGKPVVTVLKHPVDGRIVSIAEGEKLLGALGLTNDKGLIVYGKKGDYHVLCEMLPVYLGVKDFCYLDGGFEAWAAAGEKVDSGKVSPVPGTFKAQVAKRYFYVSTEEMIRLVKEKPPKVTIIDTRSPREFNAEENTVVRGGRIPGALNIPVDKNIDPHTGKLLPKKLLAEVYKDIAKDSRIILYCHRGCRTAFGFIALEMLGFKNVAVYEDGYVVWGSLPHTPVEHEHYINIRPLASGLDALRARMEQMEKELEALKAKK